MYNKSFLQQQVGKPTPPVSHQFSHLDEIPLPIVFMYRPVRPQSLQSRVVRLSKDLFFFQPNGSRAACVVLTHMVNIAFLRG